MKEKEKSKQSGKKEGKRTEMTDQAVLVAVYLSGG